MLKLLEMVDWMNGLNLRIVNPVVTHEQVNDDDFMDKLRKHRADRSTLVMHVRTIENGCAYELGFLPEEGIFVLVPFWYFRVVEQ